MDQKQVVVKICGIDPGLTNMAAWIGTYNYASHKIQTIDLIKTAIYSGKRKRGSVQETSANFAMQIADICLGENVTMVVVETAAQWNVPIRLSAAAMYGVLVGRGVPDVRYSSPTTKSKAIGFFAEIYNFAHELDQIPTNVNKLKKTISAKIRRINKRNAKTTVQRLIDISEDDKGRQLFDANSDKQDDMADAILLACGIALTTQDRQERKKKPSVSCKRVKTKK